MTQLRYQLLIVAGATAWGMIKLARRLSDLSYRLEALEPPRSVGPVGPTARRMPGDD